LTIRDRRLEWLRPAEIVEEMEQRPLVYLPLGPLEWHGPHLPLGTDALDAQAVALRVAERVGGVVSPTLFCGSERERSPRLLRDLGFKGVEWMVGMDFPQNTLKSLYFREEFLALLLREMLHLLSQQGYELVIIINGHGAENHIAVIDRISKEYTAAGSVRVVPFLAWDAPGEPLDVGHAGAIETSRVMALDPEAVDLSTLPPPEETLYNVEWGIVDSQSFEGQPTPDFTTRNDPRAGTSPERGEETLEISVSHIAAQVEAILSDMGYAPQDR
jgi:creatinine amidohydrolase